MTGRPPFNLDELLGEAHVRHYLRFIDSGARDFYVAPSAPHSDRYVTVESAPADTNQVERRGWGPDTCSSSFALAVQPQFVWDVCSYYRRLHVPFWATRRQLRLAYIRRGGPFSPRLTYAFKQLLDPVVRAAYDAATPLRPFFLDADTQEAVKRAAALEAARRTAEQGIPATVEEVLEERGIRQRRESLRDAMREGRPPQELPEDDRPLDGLPLGSSISPWERQWSWFARGKSIGWLAPVSRLEEWQRLLRRELAAREITISFAVGFCPGFRWYAWRPREGTGIVFLGLDAVPDEVLAMQAVADYLSFSSLSSPRHKSPRNNRPQGE